MLKNIALSVVAGLLVACSTPTPEKPTDPKSEEPLGGPPAPACETCDSVTPQNPVILVHGRNDTSARWDALVSSWSSKGYTENTNLFRINMSSDCGANDYCSVLSGYQADTVNESYAACLKAYIDAKVPEGNVDIVAHSQGVVTSRLYVRLLSGRVDDLVTMSGPNQGMTNCGLAGSCTGVQPEDCPDSALMHKLNGVSPEGDGSNDETTGSVTYATVVSSKDIVIQPWCSGEFITNPDTMQADDMSCRKPNYTLDSSATRCEVSSAHLVIPADQNAINFAYCRVNDD